jgi:hypothetical protein
MLIRVRVAPMENSTVFKYFRGLHIHFLIPAESQALKGVFEALLIEKIHDKEL